MRDKRLGVLLVEKGIITEEQLEKSLQMLQQGNQKLCDIIVDFGFATRKELMEFISNQVDIPYINLTPNLIDPKAAKLISAKVARQYKAIPIVVVADILTIAISDPFDIISLDHLTFASGYKLEPVITEEEKILKAIDQILKDKKGKSSSIIYSSAKNNETIEYVISDEEDRKGLEQKAQTAPVVKLVNLILTEAINENASDIHIEPNEKYTRVRYRVDGYLYEAHKFEKNLLNSLVSRLKILSHLDITEHRLPQDGRFFIKYNDRDIDFRVATTPTIYGESMIIRLLDQSKSGIQLSQIGFMEDELKRLKNRIHKIYGFVLVTGPTGSGKTTSLYAILNELNSEEIKIITIEDPVEYRLNGISQIPVSYKSGLSFPRVLRSILRQDPDVVLVGEIRDRETAQIAVQACLTGHLLLSTLHTTGTAETITRLIDIGIEPFYVREVVECIIAQRLVRRLCPKCKEKFQPNDKMLKELGISQQNGPVYFYRARGCSSCRNSGYKGRVGIFEIMEITDEIKEAIQRELSTKKLRNIAYEGGMRSLWHNALVNVIKGDTSIEEITRKIPRN